MIRNHPYRYTVPGSSMGMVKKFAGPAKEHLGSGDGQKIFRQTYWFKVTLSPWLRREVSIVI